MNNTYTSKIILSSIFFLLLFFTTLSLITSEFLSLFSQLFLLLSSDHHFYTKLSAIIFLAGSLISIYYLLRLNDIKDSFGVKCLIVALACIYMFCFVFSILGDNSDPLSILSLLSQEMGAKLTFKEYLHRHYIDIIVLSFIYTLFIYAPLLCHFSGIHINRQNKIGRFLKIFQPSLYIVILSICAVGLQPYYSKDYGIDYINFAFFIGSYILLICVYVRRRELFSFYEYSNIVLLLLWTLTVLSASNIIAESSYENARFTIILFVFIAWNIEWMEELVRKDKSAKLSPLDSSEAYV